jgi:hypothetical protein
MGTGDEKMNKTHFLWQRISQFSRGASHANQLLLHTKRCNNESIYKGFIVLREKIVV